MSAATDVARTGLRARLRDDRGSAVAEFALAGALVTVLVLSVVQLAVGLHVRTVAIDAAAEGARLGARVGMTLDDASARTRELLATSLDAGYADDVTARVVERDGASLVEVRVEAPLPVVALLGPSGGLVVTGHALAEEG